MIRVRAAGVLGLLLTTAAASADDSAAHLLSKRGCGRATGYAVTNKIVTLDKRTHVAWLDSEDDQFLVRVRSLDRQTGEWSAKTTVGEAYDNHGGPALAVDSRGYLHIVYYPHHHPFRYRRTLRPNDSSAWTPETSFGTRCTYPSLVVLPDDTLVLVCRERTDGRWLMSLYTKRVDHEWEGPRTLVHGNATSGYTRWQSALAVGDKGQMIHMSFMIYEGSEAGPGYAIGYMRSRDRGRSWERSDGSSVQLPATPDTIEIVEGDRKATAAVNLRPGNIAVGPDGTPWLLYSRLDRQPFEAKVAFPRPTGGWEKISLLKAIQRRWPDRSVKTPGEIAFDDRGRMYVAVTTVHANASVQRAYWGHQSAEVALLVSDDGARSWRTVPISRRDDQTPQWLPSLERPTGCMAIDKPSLIYTRGGRGSNNRQIMANDVIWCDLSAAIEASRGS